jgi:hypothetical protein
MCSQTLSMLANKAHGFMTGVIDSIGRAARTGRSVVTSISRDDRWEELPAKGDDLKGVEPVNIGLRPLHCASLAIDLK